MAALGGADVLFMVSAAEARDRRAEHRTFLRAAAEAGVGHVVYTSFAGAAADATFTLGRDHHDTEAAILASGLAYTILRDNFYADLLPLFADEAGVIRGPAGDGRVAAVARADVADVAAAVLREPAAHAGATYELSGPEALTLTEVAARAGAVLGPRPELRRRDAPGGLRVAAGGLPRRRGLAARRVGEHLHRDRRRVLRPGEPGRRAGHRAARPHHRGGAALLSGEPAQAVVWCT